MNVTVVRVTVVRMVIYCLLVTQIKLKGHIIELAGQLKLGTNQIKTVSLLLAVNYLHNS